MAVDYSKLSDEELQKIAGSPQPGSNNPYAQMSDEELQKIASSPVEQKKEAKPQVYGEEDLPIKTDVYGSDVNRLKSGFSDVGGALSLAKDRGYVDAKKNAEGDVIFKDAQGKWYQDASNLTSHPVNWLEAKLGKGLPTAGAIAGGAFGGVAGGGASAGLAALPAASLGAGAGAGMGETIRQAIGQQMGVRNGISPVEPVEEAVSAGAGEMIGGGVLGPLGRRAIEAVSPIGKQVVARTSSLLTGVPKEAVERLIERPGEVMGALKDGSMLDTALKGQKELLERNKREGGLISAARETSRKEQGSQHINTSGILQDAQEFLDKNRPNKAGYGAISKDEADELDKILKDNLLTSPESFLEDKGLTTRILPLSDGKQSATLIDKEGNEVGGAIFSQNGEKNHLLHIAIKPELRGQGIAGALAGDLENKTGKIIGSTSEFQTPEGQKFLSKADRPWGDGRQNGVNSASFDDLARFADWLGTKIKKFEGSRLPNAGDTPYEAKLRELYGQVKGNLHDASPELTQADQRFHQYANLTSIFGRQIENPKTAESAISNFYGRNKTAQQEAAKQLIPNTMQNIEDIGAAKEFNLMGPAGSDPGRRAIVGGGLGALTMYQGLTHGSPMQAIGGAGLAAATSPLANKWAIGGGSKMLDYFKANPEAINQVRNQALRSQIMKQLENHTPDFLKQDKHMSEDDRKSQYLQGN